MIDFTLHELQCFDAVVRTGTFQAAGDLLHRSHPSVFAAVAKLERQTGVSLLDRAGYRVQLTEAGRSFHRQLSVLLREAQRLHRHAQNLSAGEEAQLRVVLGDLCPLGLTLELLSEFFSTHAPATRLHLQFEAVTGPWERLLEDEADLIVHRVPAGDLRMETQSLGRVALVPVVAPGFLPPGTKRPVTPRQLQGYTQCVVRDSARRADARQSHFVVDGALQYSVPDHVMKKELILRGMAWGHLPRFLIDGDLRAGRLISIAGRSFPGIVEELVAARRADYPHGPVAQRLWQFLSERGPMLASAMGRMPRSSAGSLD